MAEEQHLGTTEQFRILSFVVHPGRNLIIGPDGDHSIEPKIMDVLCALADRQGAVVGRDELINIVWGRAFGTDESLTRAISQLRRIFGDVRQRGAVIETIPKRGYRLASPLERIDEPATRPAPPSPLGGRRQRKTSILLVVVLVLVLGMVVIAWQRHRQTEDEARQTDTAGVPVTIRPFDTTNARPSDRAFATETNAQLVAALSRASLLHVRAATGDSTAVSINPGTGFAVEGSVISFANGVRTTVGVIDAASGESVWSRNFDRPRDMDRTKQDAFVSAISAELDDRILVAAKAKLRMRPLASLVPWELNLLATWVPGSDEVFLHPHGPHGFWPQERALDLDPGYAPAHATLASGLSYKAMFTPKGPIAKLQQLAAQHAQQASALAPYDVSVLYALATFYRQSGDRKQAEAELARVLALQPDHPVAVLDAPFVRGLCTSSSAQSLVSLRTLLTDLSSDNPVRWVALSHIADLNLAVGDYRGAELAAESSRQIVHSTWTGLTLAASLAAQGRSKEALAVSDELKLEWPELDYRSFAARSVPQWCMGGPAVGRVRSAILALADAERNRGGRVRNS